MPRRTMIRPTAFGALSVLLILTLLGTSASAQAPRITSSTSLSEVKSLAAKGNTDAMMELGERLMQGKGVEVNAKEGLAWLQKAADAGKHEAWYALGFVYANGVGVPTDMQVAMGYFRKGAVAGDADCQTSLGLLYQAGEKIPGGVKADPVQAAKWYRLAAEQNHTEAIQHLGMLCMTGQAGKADPAEGARWFRKGAELGNPEAQWSLGMCYEQGKGVTKDLVQAYALYVAAADRADNPEQKKGMSERCEKLGKELTQSQLKEAQDVTKEWKAKAK
jgi:TPR repeat protein